MSSDVGRAVAVLLAIVLGVIAPLSIKAEVRSSTVNSLAQAAIDEMTAEVEAEGAVTLAAYEKLLTELSGIGLICETQMQVGRHELRYSDLDSSAVLTCVSQAKTQLCAAHVHTAACYRGHNHEACGCTYHTHTSSCYCSGSMTHCYRTESQFNRCTACGGSGSTGTVATCSKCGGAGYWTKQLNCNNCTRGKTYRPVRCSKCGGTGVNSKGKFCTNCNGSGNIDVLMTCDVCDGTGHWYKDFDCTECNGTGRVTTLTTCTSCKGSGGSYSTISYYECNVCGGGSTTSYGGSCGRRTCGYQTTGYTCGYSSNDTNPVCDRIIVDVAYADSQAVNLNDSAAVLDTLLTVTYMNGSQGSVNAVADSSTVFDEPGETTVNMAFTGYFENASGYGTREFPVHVTVLNGGRICEKCGRTYYPEADDDRGCPYCYRGIVGIMVDCRRYEYRKGEQLEADVYAVYDDGSSVPVPREETWNTFDSSYSGEVMVYVGYQQFLQEVTVYVLEGDEEPTLPLPSEAPPEETPDTENGEDTGSSENGENGGAEAGSDKDEGDGSITGNYIVIGSAYEEFLSTEDILEMLESGGRIELSSGDAFSVRITVENTAGFGSIFGSRSRTFTSGIIID